MQLIVQVTKEMGATFDVYPGYSFERAVARSWTLIGIVMYQN